MKKFLVLSLVLVMALAGTVFAEGVEFGGEFSTKVDRSVWTWTEEGAPGWKAATVEPGKFDLAGAKLTHNLKLNMKSSSDTWSLAANFAATGDGEPFASLDGETGYTLKVNDDLFNLTVWQGSKNSQGFVQDPFAMIQGRDKGAATVRVKTSIMDLANVTLQLEPKSSIVAHVTGDVAGANLGLIAQRKLGQVHTTDAGKEIPYNDNMVAIHGAYDFDVAKITAGAGITMRTGEEGLPELEDTFAFGAKVEAPITEEIKAEASYVLKQGDWKGKDGNSAVATVKGSYDTDALDVNASFTTTGKHVNDPETADNRTTVIGLDGTYNFTDDMNVKLAAEYKIEKDKKDLTAEELDNINTTKITANVAAPIVADLVSVKANVGYTFDNYGAILVGNFVENPTGFGLSGEKLRKQSSLAFAKSLFEAGATVTVTPIEKLTLAPSVTFKSYKDGLKEVDAANVAAVRNLRGGTNTGDYQEANYTAGSILTLKADATYAVGGGATITLSAGNNSYNFTEVDGNDVTLKYNNPFASAAVKVVF